MLTTQPPARVAVAEPDAMTYNPAARIVMLRERETPAVQRLFAMCKDMALRHRAEVRRDNVPQNRALAADSERLLLGALRIARAADELNGQIAGVYVTDPNAEDELPTCKPEFGPVDVLDAATAKRATLNIHARRCVTALVSYQGRVAVESCLGRMVDAMLALEGGQENE